MKRERLGYRNGHRGKTAVWSQRQRLELGCCPPWVFGATSSFEKA